jgi:hypothetical protein
MEQFVANHNEKPHIIEQEDGLYIVEPDTILDADYFREQKEQRPYIDVQVREKGTYTLYEFTPTSFDQIGTTINSIYTDYENSRPSRMSFDTGLIIEKRNEVFAPYSYREVELENSYKNTPRAVVGRESLNDFIHYVKAKIYEMREMSVAKEGSSARYVFISRILVACYSLPSVGVMSAYLEKHVRANSKFIYNTDSEYNICVWVAIARWLNPKMKTNPLLAFAKKMFFEVMAKPLEKYKKEHKMEKDNNYGPAYLRQYRGMVIGEENL